MWNVSRLCVRGLPFPLVRNWSQHRDANALLSHTIACPTDDGAYLDRFVLNGKPDGPLQGLDVAVKDMYAVSFVSPGGGGDSAPSHGAPAGSPFAAAAAWRRSIKAFSASWNSSSSSRARLMSAELGGEAEAGKLALSRPISSAIFWAR